MTIRADDAFAVELLTRMVETPSVSGDEAAVAELVTSYMARAGLDTTVDDAGNAIGVVGAGVPTIVLLGHLDTVAGHVPVRVDDGRLYGRGAVDAKGALAAFVCAAARHGERGGTVVVAGATGEETPESPGARHLREHLDPDVVVVGEPSGWAGVTIGYKGRVCLTYEARRPAHHSSHPSPGAAEAAVGFWLEVARAIEESPRGPRAFDQASARLDAIDATSVTARVDASCRIPPGFDFASFDRRIAQAAGTDVVRVRERTAAVVSERDSIAVRALSLAIRAEGGVPALKLKSGTSDMNVVAERWSVPMVAYGPGDSALDHTDDEHVALEEYLRSVRVLSGALERLQAMWEQEHAPSGARPDAAHTSGDGDGAAPYTPDEELALAERLKSLGYIE